MSDHPGTGRLEPELLAAYIDGQLSGEDRAKVEAEIAADPESYEWLVNAMAAVDEVSITGGGERPEPQGGTDAGDAPAPTHVAEPAPLLNGGANHGDKSKVVPFHRRPSVLGGLGALAIAASVLLVVQLQPNWYLQIRGLKAEPVFARLVAAAGEERSIEARLTGGFKYAPLRPVMRGPGEAPATSVALLTVAADLQRLAGATPTADNLHAAGVALLLVDGDDTTEAIGLLESAVASSPRPQYRVDLAAAYVNRAVRTNAPEALVRAQQQLDQALAAAPDMAEALYNRALVFELAGQVEPARQAWTTYLERAPRDPWAKDAQGRLAALSASPSSRLARPVTGRPPS